MFHQNGIFVSAQSSCSEATEAYASKCSMLLLSSLPQYTPGHRVDLPLPLPLPTVLLFHEKHTLMVLGSHIGWVLVSINGEKIIHFAAAYRLHRLKTTVSFVPWTIFRSLFIGGTGTTAFVLCWTMYYLTKYPEMLARCREEALQAAPERLEKDMCPVGLEKFAECCLVLERVFRYAAAIGVSIISCLTCY